jgi:hypothetical protein
LSKKSCSFAVIGTEFVPTADECDTNGNMIHEKAAEEPFGEMVVEIWSRVVTQTKTFGETARSNPSRATIPRMSHHDQTQGEWRRGSESIAVFTNNHRVFRPSPGHEGAL